MILKNNSVTWWGFIGTACPNVRLVNVTPSLAREWLQRNTANRPFSLQTITTLKGVLLRGGWVLNGETIIFDESGKLVSGQHRLRAVAESNVAIMSFVVFDVCEEAFHTVDQAKRRTASDLLAILGHESQKTLSSAAGLLFTHLAGCTYKSNNFRPQTQDIAALVNEFPSLIDSTALSMKLKPLGTPSMFAALHFICEKASPDKAERFFTQLATGENLSSGMPAFTLRETLIRERSSKHRRLKPVVRFVYMIKAWNAFVSEVKLTKLIWKQTMKRGRGGKETTDIPAIALDQLYGTRPLDEVRRGKRFPPSAS